MTERRKMIRVRATRAIAVEDENGNVIGLAAGQVVVVDANDPEAKRYLGDALVESE